MLLLQSSEEEDKMDQDLAVKLTMRNIRWDENIPPEYQGFCRKYLNLMYVMGFDAGFVERGKNYHGHNTQPVLVYQNGRLIDEIPTIKEAIKKYKYAPRTVERSLQYERTTHRGHLFKYKNKTAIV